MSVLEARANDALAVNPNVFTYPDYAGIAIDTHGSDWYWAVCAVMVVSTLAFIGMSFTVPRRNRLFHYITASITMTAAIAYYSMASNLGYAAIQVEFVRSGAQVSGSGAYGQFREIFYVRYIDWFVTTPLLLMDLLLTAGMPWPTVLYTIFLDEVMVVTGLVGALTASSYKWGYFVFAMVALFGIAWNVCWVGFKHASAINATVKRTFLLTGVWTIFLWFLYPIAWGLSEGGNVIGADGEAVFYGVLDILAKPVFGALLLFGHRNIDPAVLGLHIRDYDDEITHHEKGHRGATSAAAYNNTVDSTGHTTGTSAGNTTTTTGHGLAANGTPRDGVTTV